MSGATQFYAVVGAGRTSDDPSGLARRRHVPGGFIDESLRGVGVHVNNDCAPVN